MHDLLRDAVSAVGFWMSNGYRTNQNRLGTMRAAPIESTVQLQVAEYPLGPIEDAVGNLWLGSVGSGAMMWNGDMLRYSHAEDGLVGDRVTGLSIGPEGHLWLVSADEDMGWRSALMKWDGESLVREVRGTFCPAPTIFTDPFPTKPNSGFLGK